MSSDVNVVFSTASPLQPLSVSASVHCPLPTAKPSRCAVPHGIPICLFSPQHTESQDFHWAEICTEPSEMIFNQETAKTRHSKYAATRGSHKFQEVVWQINYIYNLSRYPATAETISPSRWCHAIKRDAFTDRVELSSSITSQIPFGNSTEWDSPGGRETGPVITFLWTGL